MLQLLEKSSYKCKSEANGPHQDGIKIWDFLCLFVWVLFMIGVCLLHGGVLLVWFFKIKLCFQIEDGNLRKTLIKHNPWFSQVVSQKIYVTEANQD